MNLRGLGTFLFNNEKVNLGRKYFNEAMKLDLANNDENKILKIDTYLMFSELENEFGNKENYELGLIKAMELLATIKSIHRKEEIHQRINLKLPSRLRPNA